VKTVLANYEDILTFELVGDIIKVQLTEFLGGEKGKAKWEAINEQVKKLGGEWRGGLGKNSHWAIPGKPTQKIVPAQSAKGNQLVLDAIDLLERALTKLREAGY